MYQYDARGKLANLIATQQLFGRFPYMEHLNYLPSEWQSIDKKDEETQNGKQEQAGGGRRKIGPNLPWKNIGMKAK